MLKGNSSNRRKHLLNIRAILSTIFNFSPSRNSLFLFEWKWCKQKKPQFCKYYHHTVHCKLRKMSERQMLLSTWKIDKLQPLLYLCCYYHFIGNHITTTAHIYDGILWTRGWLRVNYSIFYIFDYCVSRHILSYLDVYTNSLAQNEMKKMLMKIRKKA